MGTNVIPDGPSRRTCGTMEVHYALLGTDPTYAENRLRIESFALRRQASVDVQRSLPIVIPVVVHIVLPDPRQVTDGQVASQIAVLCADFQKLNTDVARVPAPFQPYAASAKVSFALATRDPNGAATTGITRTVTTVSSFGQEGLMKSGATGGHDAWPRDEY